MATTHARSASEDVPDVRSAKKTKTSHDTPSLAERLDPTSRFATGLLAEGNVKNLHEQYKNSGPYLHVVVEKLFQDDLLTSVKDEIIQQISFTEKETDIYKVHQTGDLASLSYLDQDQLSLLPNLLKLRDALYSPKFRSFVREVTGCGPLSGSKQDMSVNSYRKGCHLLNHDDVIGTRRVSYILYMPLPKEEEWKPEWGGSLELYPVQDGPDGIPEPVCTPSKVIPPSWNQFVFFEVQPGHSFHSVEEVVVDENGKSRQRLSISGWFHKAQEGEEGYEGDAEEKLKSSLEQLTSTTTAFTPYPAPESEEASIENLLSDKLSDEDIAFLSKYLNPIYLQNKTIEALAARFTDESSCELHSFLHESIASTLEEGLREQDRNDGLDASREGRIPPHSAGVDADGPWDLRGPPHKARFCVLRDSALQLSESSNATAAQKAARTLYEIQNTLLPSRAFRLWLAQAAMLIPLGYNVLARRFRPGLDYTLATGDDDKSRLDVVLGLTPSCAPKIKNGRKKEEQTGTVDWEDGEWGGWECYMAPHEGEEDPAVYRSGPSKSSKRAEASGSTPTAKLDDKMDTDNAEKTELKPDDDQEMEGVEEDEDEDEGTLLTAQPGFNRLLLVLRDEGVMRFVKYVSASANGSRFDVCVEFEVGIVEVEEGSEVEEDEDADS